jgi:hypothetical protein
MVVIGGGSHGGMPSFGNGSQISMTAKNKILSSTN